MIRFASILAICLLSFTGCATIVSKSSKDVTFTSEPAGAKVTIESRKPGRYYTTTTPGTITLSKKASYFATFSLEGFHVVTTPVDRQVGKAAAGSGGGNLLLLGFLAPIGMGIDAMSGAAATLPDTVHMDMAPLADPTPGNAGDIAHWRQVAEEERQKRRNSAGDSEIRPGSKR